MDQLKAVITLTAAMLAFVAIAPSAHAAPKGIPVQITNDTTTPVPVNGNVVVSGTANVNVTNPVTIGNSTPIPVSITGTIPALVVDHPEKSAVTSSIVTTITGAYGVSKAFGNFIPKGSRFVMEVASLNCLSDIGSFPVLTTLNVHDKSGGTAYFTIPIQYQGAAQGLDFHSGNLTAHVYIDGDAIQPPEFELFRSTQSGMSSCNLTLSGYLVTL
jgi:hypothetical protein